jgi:hypothetical protein
VEVSRDAINKKVINSALHLGSICAPRHVVDNQDGSGAEMAKAPAKSKKPPARKPWSKDDVRLLKGMARKEPASKIAKALKRTEGATRQKATALSISLNLSRKKAGPAKKAAPAKKAGPAKKAAAAKKSAPAKKAAPTKTKETSELV